MTQLILREQYYPDPKPSRRHYRERKLLRADILPKHSHKNPQDDSKPTPAPYVYKLYTTAK